jgi:hypothetical protein
VSYNGLDKKVLFENHKTRLFIKESSLIKHSFKSEGKQLKKEGLERVDLKSLEKTIPLFSSIHYTTSVRNFKKKKYYRLKPYKEDTSNKLVNKVVSLRTN